tara:strand:+ start:161 stop:457 length:297 start_codon:yes stop_codon:yes gene_type:complete
VKIPEKIKMGGHEISITLRELDEEHGYFDSGRLEIHINNAGPESLQYETYIHELIEAACFFVEADLPHPLIQSLGLLLAQAIDTSRQEGIDENAVVGD